MARAVASATGTELSATMASRAVGSEGKRRLADESSIHSTLSTSPKWALT